MMSMDPFSHFNALNAAAASAVAEKISGQLPGVNKRVYYCQRCLNHGRLEPRKNHKCECSFASCTCTKCILVEKRRVLNTQLHELEESVETAGNENSVEGISAGGDSALLEVLNEEMSPFDEKGDLSGSGRIKGERVPNCQKCGQHGRKSRLKGHKRVCPFKDCNCAKCQVVTERQKLMADQIKIRRRQRKDTLMNLTREKITATLNAAAAVAAAGPLPYLNNLSMIYNQLNPVSTSVPSVIPTSSTSPNLGMSAPTAFTLPPQPVTSLPANTNYLQTPSEAFLKAVAMSSASTEPICTSPMQLNNFPLFLNTSQSAALAALTSSPPALPISTKTEKQTEIIEDNQSPSPSGSSPPSLDTFCGLNGLATKTTTPPVITSLPHGLPTQEQLLAFLANVQFPGVFPGMTQATTPTTSEALADSIAKAVASSMAASQPSAVTTTTSFVDVCSV